MDFHSHCGDVARSLRREGGWTILVLKMGMERTSQEPFPGMLGTFLGLSWNSHWDWTPWNCRGLGDSPDGSLGVVVATGETG